MSRENIRARLGNKLLIPACVPHASRGPCHHVKEAEEKTKKRNKGPMGESVPPTRHPLEAELRRHWRQARRERQKEEEEESGSEVG